MAQTAAREPVGVAHDHARGVGLHARRGRGHLAGAQEARGPFAERAARVVGRAVVHRAGGVDRVGTGRERAVALLLAGHVAPPLLRGVGRAGLLPAAEALAVLLRDLVVLLVHLEDRRRERLERTAA